MRLSPIRGVVRHVLVLVGATPSRSIQSGNLRRCLIGSNQIAVCGLTKKLSTNYCPSSDSSVAALESRECSSLYSKNIGIDRELVDKVANFNLPPPWESELPETLTVDAAVFSVW